MKLSTLCVVCQAVAHVQCDGVSLKGRVPEMRTQLATLLPEGDRADDDDSDCTPDNDEATPEYETQDTWDDQQSSEEETDEPEPHIDIRIELKDMNVGDAVEVYWKGDNKWYEGEILDVCEADKTYVSGLLRLGFTKIMV